MSIPTPHSDRCCRCCRWCARAHRGGNIVTADIDASNGVIHVIDCVLTP